MKLKGVIYDENGAKSSYNFAFLMTNLSSPHKEKLLSAFTISTKLFDKMRNGHPSSYFNDNYIHDGEHRFHLRHDYVRGPGYSFLLTDKKTGCEYLFNTKDVYLIANPKTYKNRNRYKQYFIDDFILEEECESNNFFPNYKLKNKSKDLPYITDCDSTSSETEDVFSMMDEDQLDRYNTIMETDLTPKNSKTHELVNSNFVENNENDELLQKANNMYDEVESEIKYHTSQIDSLTSRIEYHRAKLNKIKPLLTKYNSLASTF
jgi:hypothetical protein